MILNSFRFNVLARVLLICILIGILSFAVLQKQWIATSLVLSFIICFVVVSLLRYVERTNSEFSDFLQSIRSADFARYNEDDKRGTSFSALKQAFNTIVEEFQTTRIDKEAHYVFLQTVVSNVNTAIISFDSKGDIKILNRAAQELLDLPFLDNIHQLSRINRELYNSLASGANEILPISVQEKRLKLLFRSASFRIQDNEHRLILITNVKPEIDRAEVEAWEQLLHVLTHEIMNSITPISSLSGTIKDHLNSMIKDDVRDGEMLHDMAEGLQVIENRSAGLIAFVNNYKTLITLPEPDLQRISVGKLFDRLLVLTGRHLEQKGVTLKIESGGRLLFIIADDGLIEQVLLNLIYNAADAVAGCMEPRIVLSAGLQNEKTTIRISDNGAGIDPDIMGKIFIPFFTTKNTGTGIGLSLSKQIMHQHNGSIDVYSTSGKGSVFTLSFP